MRSQEQVQTLTHGASWTPKRLSVVPHGFLASKMSSKFVDDLEAARSAKKRFLARGAEVVDIFDTVEGIFLQ